MLGRHEKAYYLSNNWDGKTMVASIYCQKNVSRVLEAQSLDVAGGGIVWFITFLIIFFIKGGGIFRVRSPYTFRAEGT